jgi:predicted metal-binding protein
MFLIHDGNRLSPLIDEALNRGAQEARFIPVRSVATAPRVRLKCPYGDDRFGTSHCCPPKTPTPKEIQEILDGDASALLVHFGGMTARAPATIEKGGVRYDKRRDAMLQRGTSP